MSSKKDEILLTAKRLFAEKGYQAVGVDTITNDSGVSKMTLYNHFKTKENLIVEVLRERDAEFIDSLEDRMSTVPPGRLRLKALFDWHIDWFRSANFHGCMFIKASEEFCGQSEPIMMVAREHKSTILKMIEDCLIADGVKQHSTAAKFLFILVEGMIVNAHMFGADTGMGLEWVTAEAALDAVA